MYNKKHLTEEHKKKISLANIGRHHNKQSEETKKKIRKHSINMWKDDNYRQKILNARRETIKKNGYVNSPEAKKKVSVSLKNVVFFFLFYYLSLGISVFF